VLSAVIRCTVTCVPSSSKETVVSCTLMRSRKGNKANHGKRPNA
jgi:hypothetical protein